MRDKALPRCDTWKAPPRHSAGTGGTAMKLKAFIIGLVAVVATTSLLAQDAAREQKLQQAIDLLETKGDAARAMPLLEEVSKSSDRRVAARGLLYLGQAQERQGNTRARATYER